MPRWTVQFVIDDGQGGALVELKTVEAASHALAIQAAYLIAPKQEFMLNVVAESPEQFLGQVRSGVRIFKGEAKRAVEEA
jgi:hypothetical protein